VTLELGGKSPQLFFADAGLNTAAATVVNAIIENCGQTCTAGSRVLIEDFVYDDFTANRSARFSALRVGPSDRNLPSRIARHRSDSDAQQDDDGLAFPSTFAPAHSAPAARSVGLSHLHSPQALSLKVRAPIL
jgi:hypothetical protein